MKKTLFFILMILSIVFAGCSSKPVYETTIHVPEKFTAGQEIPISLQVKKENQPVTGLAVSAVLEMKKMNHGTVDVTFTEKGNGEYTANVMLPMGGEWVAVTQLKSEKDTVEQEIGFTIKGEE